MKSGKRVLGVIIVSLLLIVSVSFVSASWKDWFGFGDKNENLKGELPESAAARLKISDVSVPNIVFVSNVSHNGPFTDSNLVKLIPNPSDTVASFWFLAQQGGSQQGDLIYPSGRNSRVNFTRSGELSRENLSCTYIGVVSCGGLCTGNAVNFTCTVPMKYYDGNGTWNMNVSVKAGSTDYGYNVSKTFNVLATYAASALTDYLNFTSPSLTTALVNRASDNNITVRNNGNVNYSGVLVNPVPLVGMTTPSEYVASKMFRANGCGAVSYILINNTDTPIPGFSAVKALSDPPGRTTDLSFCVSNLTDNPTSLSSQDYNSTTRNWVLTLAQS